MQQQQQNSADVELTRNEAASRYELRIGDQVAAQAQYRVDENGCVCFTHTEVNTAHEGQGLGSRLAAYALDDVKRRGMKAVPQCRFIASYIARHEKDYGDVVAR